MNMKDKVLEVSFKLLLHTSFLYGLFIYFHGEESAGGGFQAGAIFGSIFLVYQFIFDDEDYLMGGKIINYFLFSGILLYFGYGVFTMIIGGKFLEYDILSKMFSISSKLSQTIGIMVVEMGVLLVVAFGMIKMGYSFKRIFDKSRLNNFYD